MATFTLQWQCRVVATETESPAKPEIFTILPFKKKFAEPGLV